jgi:hypothetical protein
MELVLDKSIFGILTDNAHIDEIISFLGIHHADYGDLDLKLARFGILYISQNPEQQKNFLNAYKKAGNPFNFIKKYNKNGHAYIPEREFEYTPVDYSKLRFKNQF